jgi:D-alanine transfer protein
VRKALPHLLPALAAILILFGLLAGGSLFARYIELRYVNTLAPDRLKQTDVGSALQEAAFLRPDLLPVYGSSEMFEEDDENSAYRFFQTYPTGFTVFEVAASGMTSLEIAQNLAALGPEIKGKKVVISFTPSMFTSTTVSEKEYSGDFSRLHANELVFSPYISFDLKQHIASRMLDYPDTFADDPILGFALQNLASSSPFNLLLYYLSVPVGRLQVQVIRLQDHWDVLNWIYSNPQALLPIPRKTYSIDWKAEMARAHKLQTKLTSNNPFGIENNEWNRRPYLKLGKNINPFSSDKNFLEELSNSKEWEDFDILLSVLKEIGAQPLFLSRPLNGEMWNALGVSLPARQVFYVRLQATVQPYGFPLVDFYDQDTNRLFSVDLFSHTSRLGWVYVDQALDAFYHATIH